MSFLYTEKNKKEKLNLFPKIKNLRFLSYYKQTKKKPNKINRNFRVGKVLRR